MTYGNSKKYEAATGRLPEKDKLTKSTIKLGAIERTGFHILEGEKDVWETEIRHQCKVSKMTLQCSTAASASLTQEADVFGRRTKHCFEETGWNKIPWAQDLAAKHNAKFTDFVTQVGTQAHVAQERDDQEMAERQALLEAEEAQRGGSKNTPDKGCGFKRGRASAASVPTGNKHEAEFQDFALKQLALYETLSVEGKVQFGQGNTAYRLGQRNIKLKGAAHDARQYALERQYDRLREQLEKFDKFSKAVQAFKPLTPICKCAGEVLDAYQALHKYTQDMADVKATMGEWEPNDVAVCAAVMAAGTVHLKKGDIAAATSAILEFMGPSLPLNKEQAGDAGEVADLPAAAAYVSQLLAHAIEHVLSDVIDLGVSRSLGVPEISDLVVSFVTPIKDKLSEIFREASQQMADIVQTDTEEYSYSWNACEWVIGCCSLTPSEKLPEFVERFEEKWQMKVYQLFGSSIGEKLVTRLKAMSTSKAASSTAFKQLTDMKARLEVFKGRIESDHTASITILQLHKDLILEYSKNLATSQIIGDDVKQLRASARKIFAEVVTRCAIMAFGQLLDCCI